MSNAMHKLNTANDTIASLRAEVERLKAERAIIDEAGKLALQSHLDLRDSLIARAKRAEDDLHEVAEAVLTECVRMSSGCCALKSRDLDAIIAKAVGK